ncbi:MAG: hypothetical protein K6F82_00265 [Sphaerochaetaceae bacterium]|nr:hypothetical protein [Sphaerochaetaceae bacterium]
MPRHQSQKHPHMSLYDRSAQFAPFAALTGYEDMVEEEARLTGVEKRLSDSEKDVISSVLTDLSQQVSEGGHPEVKVVHFVPDRLKSGGEYRVSTGVLKNVDSYARTLVFYAENGISDGKSIEIEKITEVRQL